MILVPYDPRWAEEFEILRDILQRTAGGLATRIEPVGSTAIPGLHAKPILDVDVVVTDWQTFPLMVERLRAVGYEHQGDLGVPDREAFRRLDEQVPWTEPRRSWTVQHLYVCPAGSRELRRHVAFRDALRANADWRREYQELKLGAERRSGGDRKLYQQIKEAEARGFIEGVIAQADASLA